MHSRVFITHGCRTAIGKMGGALSHLPSETLAKRVVDNLVQERAGIPASDIEGIILGEVKQRSNPSNLARYTALNSCLGDQVPGYTIHRQCGSGLQAIMDGSDLIATGAAKAVIVGGAESMSQSAYFIRNAGKGLGNGNHEIEDSLTAGGPGAIPADKYGNVPMGVTAENLAEKYEISRSEQDEYAQMSQERMANAISSGYFVDQITSVELAEGKHFVVDEHPFLTSLEKLSTMRPAFKKGGSVTPGNSSGRNDGAAALILMSEEMLNRHSLKPMAEVVSYGSSGCDPLQMGLGPVESTRIALERAGLKLSDIDVIELNEAFAAQTIAVMREWEKWGVPRAELLKRTNPNGGAIAHGHPLGCTGAALTVKCIYELQRRRLKYGLVTLCCAGGLGVSMVVKSVLQ